MTKRPEDPVRLHNFREAIKNLRWDDKDYKKPLTELFTAVDNLADAEVHYYFRRRNTRAWISGITRTLAWVTGSAGLLLPLLAAATDGSKQAALYGYVLLALAASFLAANSLFGGTDGHIRFVSTQLSLEKLMTASRIAWCRYLAMGYRKKKCQCNDECKAEQQQTEQQKTEPQEIGEQKAEEKNNGEEKNEKEQGKERQDDELELGFKLILDYATALHTLTIDETGQWGQALLAELANFRKSVDSRNGTDAGSKKP